MAKSINKSVSKGGLANVNSSRSGYCLGVDCCEHDNKPSNSIKGMKHSASHEHCVQKFSS
jgi:hypothetical protein